MAAPPILVIMINCLPAMLAPALRRTLLLSLFLGVSAWSGAPAKALLFKTILGPEVSGATGSGTATVSIDEVTNLMRVKVNFLGLSGNTTVAHIHGPTTVPLTGTASVMTPTPTFPGFPAGTGVSSGSYDQTFDLLLSSSYRSGFITANGGTPTGARNGLIAALKGRQAYLNIHSSAFPGGEIRGFFIQETPSPLPMVGAAAAMAWSRRIRRRVDLAAR